MSLRRSSNRTVIGNCTRSGNAPERGYISRNAKHLPHWRCNRCVTNAETADLCGPIAVDRNAPVPGDVRIYKKTGGDIHSSHETDTVADGDGCAAKKYWRMYTFVVDFRQRVSPGCRVGYVPGCRALYIECHRFGLVFSFEG